VGAWAFLLIDAKSGTALERAGAVPETTNNRMEMRAAIEALQAVRRPSSQILMFSDSKYLINCCSAWMQGWKAKGWQRKGEPLKNLDLLQELDVLVSRHQVTWRWVAGHSGEVGNERVDLLANEAMDRFSAGQPHAWDRRYKWTEPVPGSVGQ
jgi:ribonuclease HI